MRLIDADKLLLTLEKEQAYLEEESLIDRSLGIGDAIIDLVSVPTVDVVERIEYEKMKDLAEQYKFEYECIFEAHKEVLNEVLPNRVEVVRCKDCKEYKYCFLLPNDDDYCSKGERKEE